MARRTAGETMAEPVAASVPEGGAPGTLSRPVLVALAYRALAASGLPRTLQRSCFPQQLSILTYHAVVRESLPVADWCFLSEQEFSRQLAYVKRTFAVIPLSEAVARMREGSIRRPTAVLTFDDGFYNNYSIVFPILREARLPATIFLTTGLIHTEKTVWFCYLNRALTRCRQTSIEWQGRRFVLDHPRQRAEAATTIKSLLKGLPHPQLLSEVETIVGRLGVDLTAPIERDSPYRMLDHGAIETMAKSGFVEFGAHTRTHAILSRLPEAEQRAEIVGSVEAVAGLTGRPCTLFAYPNGQRCDYDAATIGVLEACGVTSCVTTLEGPNDATTPPLELRRYGVGAGTTQGQFEVTIHHLRAKIAAYVRPS